MPCKGRLERLRIAERGWIRPKPAMTKGARVAAKFVLWKGSTGKYRFNLVAPNGHVLATSETYESKPSALNGIKSVKRNAPNAEIEEQTGSAQMREVARVDDDGKTGIGGLLRRLKRGQIALIGLVVGALIPTLVNYSAPGVIEKIKGEPPVVYIVGYDGDVYSDGFEMALPGTLDDAGQAPTTMTCTEVHGWLVNRGAADIDNTFLKLSVVGARNQGVQITDMHARIKKRESPPHGADIECPSGGSNESARVMFNLDSSYPQALLDEGNDQPPSRPWFKGNNITLAKNESFVFEVRAITSKCYCSWTIELTVRADRKEQVIEISNGSQPFKTTARASSYGTRYLWMGHFVPSTAP
jgi:uncharacterized protein